MGKKEKVEARAKRRQQKLMKKIVVWVLVLVGAGALVFFLAGSGGDLEVNGGAIEPVNAEDWVKWNPEASVTLVEYSDFQCPACASYLPILKSLESEFSGSVKFVYRHFPLAQIHFNANAAARATEAAGNQGKFWEMHDKVFETQIFWASSGNAEEVFAGYAADLGLDVERFRSDFDSDDARDRVTADYTEGVKAGINSTPSFFINGEKIQNPRDDNEFRAALNKALEESGT